MATVAVPKTKLAGGSWLIEDHNTQQVFTPEDFTDEHQQIAQTTEEFSLNEIVPNGEKIEHKDYALQRELLRKASEIGIANVDVPEEYGGSDMDKVSSAIVGDRIAKNASFTTTWGAHCGIGTLPIVYFGTEEQKKKYLPRLAKAEIVGAYALSESTSASDAMNARTKAVLSPDGKHYILNGEKMWITNGGFADVFTIFAKVDGDKFTAFLVERSMGVVNGRDEIKLGLDGSSTTALMLDNVKVPVENVLGTVGQGHKVAFNVLNFGRVKLGARNMSGVKLALGHAVKYARE